MPRILRAIVAMTAALLLAGCSTTLVQSLPIGKTTTCDPAWPGRWRAVDPEHGQDSEKHWVEINADCTEITSVDDGSTSDENFKLNLVSTRVGDYLWFSDSDRKPECLHSDGTQCGFALVKYVRTNNEIRLYQPDHGKVHEAIAAHLVPGYIETRDNNETPTVGHGNTPGVPTVSSSTSNTSTVNSANGQKAPQFGNLLSGNSEQITTILGQHPEFFESKPWMILRRDGPTMDNRTP